MNSTNPNIYLKGLFLHILKGCLGNVKNFMKDLMQIYSQTFLALAAALLQKALKLLVLRFSGTESRRLNNPN